jgi:hypothetical protein
MADPTIYYSIVFRGQPNPDILPQPCFKVFYTIEITIACKSFQIWEPFTYIVLPRKTPSVKFRHPNPFCKQTNIHLFWQAQAKQAYYVLVLFRVLVKSTGSLSQHQQTKGALKQEELTNTESHNI